ncbi:hypothetical protein ACK8P5_25875 (plasmid) [Paenibacillus sp. EC2-1]|uniref:hypothetical protein n=1 Tax=Paenibacillus sp. EC2-1 TaxID=3388665 RepID=UPI003BEEC812
MRTMTNTNKRLAKWNLTRRQMMQDMEDIAFAKKNEYHNSGVSAYNAEVHALRGQLEYTMDIIAEQSSAMIDMMKDINELRSLLMKGVRTGDIHIEHTTTTTTTTTETTETLTITTPTGRKPKWDKDSIFREFDMYRREYGLFGRITPEIVRNNWSTIAMATRKYTGMTLKELLDLYAHERDIY